MMLNEERGRGENEREEMEEREWEKENVLSAESDQKIPHWLNVKMLALLVHRIID